jgi:hypothetical protein
MAHVWLPLDLLEAYMLRRLLNRENLSAILLCLILIAILILTVDQAPLWIYQGF